MGGGDLLDHGFGQHAFLLPERAPALDRDAAVGEVPAQVGACERGRELDLVHGRDAARLRDQPVQVVLAEVRDADAADQALCGEVDHRAVGLDVPVEAGEGPVDQVEVDVVETQPVEARVQRVAGRVVPLVRPAELGRDEQLGAVHA
ncbi:hypothetical protein D3C74_353610 [compost metagenome]